jgi:hypothetical protein
MRAGRNSAGGSGSCEIHQDERHENWAATLNKPALAAEVQKHSPHNSPEAHAIAPARTFRSWQRAAGRVKRQNDSKARLFPFRQDFTFSPFSG